MSNTLLKLTWIGFCIIAFSIMSWSYVQMNYSNGIDNLYGVQTELIFIFGSIVSVFAYYAFINWKTEKTLKIESAIKKFNLSHKLYIDHYKVLSKEDQDKIIFYETLSNIEKESLDKKIVEIDETKKANENSRIEKTRLFEEYTDRVISKIVLILFDIFVSFTIALAIGLIAAFLSGSKSIGIIFLILVLMIRFQVYMYLRIRKIHTSN